MPNIFPSAAEKLTGRSCYRWNQRWTASWLRSLIWNSGSKEFHLLSEPRHWVRWTQVGLSLFLCFPSWSWLLDPEISWVTQFSLCDGSTSSCGVLENTWWLFLEVFALNSRCCSLETLHSLASFLQAVPHSFLQALPGSVISPESHLMQLSLLKRLFVKLLTLWLVHKCWQFMVILFFVRSWCGHITLANCFLFPSPSCPPSIIRSSSLLQTHLSLCFL